MLSRERLPPLPFHRHRHAIFQLRSQQRKKSGYELRLIVIHALTSGATKPRGAMEVQTQLLPMRA
jgi:hypothetical protein